VSDANAEGSDPARSGDEVSTAEKRLEIIATLLLALTAVATAWSGYQASLWDGIQSSNYTQASAARTEAAEKHTEANQLRLADLSVFENFIDADIDGDTELRAFYRSRFSDPLEAGYEAWTALDPRTNPDAPPSPLAMPEYEHPEDRESRALLASAEDKFADGEEANDDSDAYTATTLLFAAALFFAAISERFEYRRVRISLLGFGAFIVVVGVGLALTQPVTSG
jgi:hypothetical protein